MTPKAKPSRIASSFLGWLCAPLVGALGASATLLPYIDPTASTTAIQAMGPIFAIGLMGSGMIGAALTGSFAKGMMIALVCGLFLTGLSFALGTPFEANLLALGIAIAIASVSFAARGALFARSAGDRGWFIASAIVAGEGAILVTAFLIPDALPKWLLSLLPARWASLAIQSTGAEKLPHFIYPLLALGGTAAATALVTKLLPKRMPYLIMFTVWLCLSTLVYHQTDWDMVQIEEAGTQSSIAKP